MSLLAVSDALRIMCDAAPPIETCEAVPLAEAAGRTLGRDLVAPRDQPPFPASAMDGYAVRSTDLPGEILQVGESAAGRRYSGTLGPGECCRIFTGAVVPSGADAVLIQENADATGNCIRSQRRLEPGAYVRPAGLDYKRGQVLLTGGAVLSAAGIALHASCGFDRIEVRRRPRIAIVMSGDELAMPGERLELDGIYASNGYGVAVTVAQAGGEPIDMGIVRDDRTEIAALLDRVDADIVVTLGGASVGDHDLIRPALEAHGVKLSFLKLAMRPGKPVMFGTRGTRLFLGLPGNPVSSLVGANVLLVPLIERMLGRSTSTAMNELPLAVDLPTNGDREHYMRATVADGVVTPHENQDSSLLRLLAVSDVLIVRERNDRARKAGESVPILPL